ncbi:postreplication repair E3 ubiquitin-protein ligase RAD18 [Lucilia cuprina]|uniref:postreplication repair E3 ubiquitin-protein ligase RAD18 n=1 Tax=Lucilia cuprina TaxID=7375 RepID=UPI001F061B39|nr:postreplication repair E3 ubiquitin-protein ligase RAD18 [Lucilia cuprina]
MTDSMTAASAERCVLCLDQKRSPVRIHCGHSFCYGCLDVYKSYKKYPWANKCPICRDALKEKKTTKRKYSEMNSMQNNSTTININSMLSASQSIPPEEICILEEFMALASDYDNSGENLSDNTQQYIDLDEYENDTIHDLTGNNDDDNDNYDEDDQSDFENNSYEEELDFYSDTDGDVDDDEDDDNYYYFAEDGPGGSREVPSTMTRDCYNTDIDWETVIGSDVIIID